MTGVRLERHGHVAVMTIDRPERANSLDHDLLAAGLPAAWAEVREDPGVAAVVLTASGDRFFCTGVDLKDPQMQAISTGDAPPFPIRITARQNEVWKPVICAVNGGCVGGGLMLVADSDVVLASPGAWFSNPAVRVGITAMFGPVVLARSADFRTVLRMSIAGDDGRLSAEAAVHAGIVGEVVPAEGLVDHAIGLATAIAANSPAAVQETVEVLWRSLDLSLPDARVMAEDRAERWRDHPDAAEGFRAWRERRQPSWAAYAEADQARGRGVSA